jgi:hypothetical protein
MVAVDPMVYYEISNNPTFAFSIVVKVHNPASHNPCADEDNLQILGRACKDNLRFSKY